LLVSSEYVITPAAGTDAAALGQRVSEFMAQKRIMRTRRDKPYDLRPLVHWMKMDDQGQIHVELSLSEGGTGRPDELVDELGLSNTGAAIHRVKINVQKG